MSQFLSLYTKALILEDSSHAGCLLVYCCSSGCGGHAEEGMGCLELKLIRT